ncbi:MAG: AzlC family ABC transporter permease [Proteobacteria bacterium]|nr:AzlC family ABC transporter permease [Pseudomonadota bacterium]MBU1594994.1 AzlC family ABC transporter permease [Pseudomonadota bacterium]
MNAPDPAQADGLRFSFPGLVAGFRACLPVALGVAVYGVLFGLLARQKGLSLAEAQAMSLLVFAGASQLIALDLWGPNLAVASLILTTFIVNLRHVLMGAALSPWLTRLAPGQAFGSLFFMTDESWALTLGRMAEDTRQRREPDGAFLLGAGLAVYVFWNLSTALGHTLVRGLDDPARYGLDFAFTAVFTALLVGLRPRRGDILPLLAATATALLCARLLPGKWYILAGAAAGGLAAAFGPTPVAGPAGKRP